MKISARSIAGILIAVIVVAFMFGLPRPARVGNVSANPARDPATNTDNSNRIVAEQPAAMSVTDFGAKGDNSTDDTSAIQAAFDAAKVKQGQVFIPPGKYKCSSPIHVPNGVGILGAGGSSILIFTDCNGLLWGTAGSNTTPVRISDFILRGDGSRNDHYGTHYGMVVGAENANAGLRSLDSATISNISFQGWKAGIFAHDLWDSVIEHDTFAGCFYGVWFHGQSCADRVIDNWMDPQTGKPVGRNSTGVLIEGASDYDPGGKTFEFPQDIQIVRNKVINYDIGIDQKFCYVTRIRDNDLDFCHVQGLRFSADNGGLVIDGNYIALTGPDALYGINADASKTPEDQQKIISNNYVIGYTPLNAKSVGIEINQNQHDAKVENNQIRGMSLDDIQVQSASRAAVTGNECLSAKSQNSIAVSSAGDHTVIDRNYVQQYLFVKDDPGAGSAMEIGDTFGIQSTRIRGKSIIAAGTKMATTTFASQKGAPPNFHASGSGLFPSLRIETPVVNIGAIWGKATDTGVTINCAVAPTTDTAIGWEVVTETFPD